MIGIAKIEDAWIVDIKAKIASLKTVDTLEAPYDDRTPQGMILLTPFVLLRYGGLGPLADQRMADEGSGIKKGRFFLSVGSTSLRDRSDAQRGCYSILDALRALYDGGTITTSDGDVNLALENEEFVNSGNGLMVYGAEYSYYEV